MTIIIIIIIIMIIIILNNNNNKLSFNKFRKHNIKQKEQIPTVIEKLKRQLKAKAQRVERFEKRQKFFHQDKTFKENA